MTRPMADCHNDLLMAVQFRRDQGDDDPFGDFWLPQLRAGGVVLQVLPIWTDHQFVSEGALRRALQTVETTRQLAQRHAADVALVTSAGQLRETIAGGRIALVLSFEGMEPVAADIDLIDTFWHLGLRMASLTWNRRTPFADGMGERQTGAGLTSLGVRAIERMESLGMIIDVSHLSDAGFDDIARLSTRPFVASHSSCRAVNEHPRNLRDDQLRAIAATGGFVGINGVGDFVGGDRSVDAFLDHVEHAVDLIGPEHVALGVDFLSDVDAQTRPADAQRREVFIDGLRHLTDLPTLGGRLDERLGPDAGAQVCSDSMIESLGRLLPD